MPLGLIRRVLINYAPSVTSLRGLQTRLCSSTAVGGADHDQPLPHFTFSEEPLGIPACEGFGYFQGVPGDTLGHRFKLQAKLGFGTTSSVWLARDHDNNMHVAVKILTGYATQLNRESKLRELEVLQCLSSMSQASTSHLARMVTYFYHPGVEDDGEHLCLVMELLGPSIQATREALKDRVIPVLTVKHALRHMLLGLTCLHTCGVAHTDLKPDNIMVELGSRWTPEAINSWVKANPPRTYAPEQSLTKMVSAFVSQSLPPPALDEFASLNFKLADFSSAQFVSDQTTDDITPLGLRPPEIVLGGEWDESVDIWTYGCMVFTLLTGRPLFAPVAWAEKDASEVDVLLYQMILFCGEFFKQDFIRHCSRSLDYFRLDYRLKKFQHFVRKPFQKCILDTGRALTADDVEGAAALMSRCLRLDPKDRATAQELLEDPWLKS